jgi:hypothetical protein
MYLNQLKNEYKIISIGFMCYGKKFIDKYIEKTETQFFDYIGTSVPSIISLFENNFYIDNNLLYDINNYILYKTLTNEYIVTNIKLNIKFMHDFVKKNNNDTISEIELLSLKEKYTRRAYRFMELLNKTPKILFLRLEEDRRNLIHEQQQIDACLSELEQLKILSKIIKNKNPLLKYEIIFITTKESTKYIEEYNILIIYSTLSLEWQNENGINWGNCDIKIKELFDKNEFNIEKYILKNETVKPIIKNNKILLKNIKKKY